MTISLKNSKLELKCKLFLYFYLNCDQEVRMPWSYRLLVKKNKQLVTHYCQEIEDSFKKDILPTRLGIKSLNRETLIQDHTTEVARKLYDCNRLFLICVCTYIQKSSNNEYQRKSYTDQKKISLCKPFTCAADRFIIDMLGPSYANQNDPEIIVIVIKLWRIHMVYGHLYVKTTYFFWIEIFMT